MGAVKNKTQTLVFLCLVLFLDAVGFGLILPVLPGLITELSDLPNSQAAIIAGYLLFTFALMQFFFAPILGALSDRFGRRPILLIALFGFSLDYFVMAAAPNLTWLFIARMISGVFGATYAAANASIVDMSEPEERAKVFGWGGAAVGLGFVFGPAIGGLLGEYGTRIPFIVAGILVLLTCIYGFFTLKETLPVEKRRAFSWKRANPLGNVITIANYPLVLTILLSVFFMQLANHSFSSIWPFYTIEVAEWSPLLIGLSVAFYGIMMAFVQGGLTGPAVKAFGEVKMGLFSYALGIATFLGLAFAANGTQIYIWIFIGGFTAFAYPVTQALMTKNTPENAQGELQGALASGYSLSAIIGPLIMSQLFGSFTDERGYYLPGAPFLGACVLIIISAIIFSFGIRQSLSRPR